MEGRASLPTVSAVMAVKNPDLASVAETLDSVSRQNYPVTEAIIVDSSDTPLEADVDGIETRMIYAPSDDIAQARSRGVREARGDYVVHLDEDGALVREDYISSALERLQQDGVSAAGGVVGMSHLPADGKAFAFAERVVPSDLCTHQLVHSREMVRGRNRSRAFPQDHGGEDITNRDLLREFGKISRMADQPVKKERPTTRQRIAEEISVGAIVGGAVTGIVTSAVQRGIRRLGDTVEETAFEETP